MQDRIKHTPNQSVKLGSWNHFKRGGAHTQRESLFKDEQLKTQVTSIILFFFIGLKLREVCVFFCFYLESCGDPPDIPS